MAKILIIEDEDLVAQVLENFLINYGHNCEIIKPEGDLNSVLSNIKEDFDLILCDFMMPNVTGWDIFNALNENLKKRIIIITGGYIDEDKESFLKEKNVDIILKPFDIKDIIFKIDEKLERESKR